MSKNVPESDIFTQRNNEQTNVKLSLCIRERQIEINYTTPENIGYMILDVPLERRFIEKYLHPLVFDEMIERMFPARVQSYSFNSRVYLEEDEYRRICESKKKSKGNKQNAQEQ